MDKVIFGGLLGVFVVSLAVAVNPHSELQKFCYEAELVGIDPWNRGEVDHLYHPLPPQILKRIDSLPTYPMMLICSQSPDSAFKFQFGVIG